MEIPGARMKELPVLKYDDEMDINEIAVKQKFDFVSVPGVVSARDLQEIKKVIQGDSKVAILAKIDSLEAVHQFQGILKYADGVIIVRNELAFELEPEKLMIAQKWMTQQANHEAKPIFLQSQVLESMLINHMGDARQETTDISSAVQDGVDVFILSHETSIGQFSLEATMLLAKAIAEAENCFDYEVAF